MESAEPYREFIREMMLRFDRRTTAWDRRLESQHKEYLAHFELVEAEMRELRADSRVHREALLRILDRLDNGGGATA